MYHACFGSGDRLGMVDVWESRESRDAFVDTLLRLPGEWEGLDPGVTEVLDLHDEVVGLPVALAV